MKKWLIAQLTQLSAWIGFSMIVGAILHLPYWVFFSSGLALVLTNDTQLQALCAKIAPGLAKRIDEIST